MIARGELNEMTKVTITSRNSRGCFASMGTAFVYKRAIATSSYSRAMSDFT
mgnify:CR=1 FL=1